MRFLNFLKKKQKTNNEIQPQTIKAYHIPAVMVDGFNPYIGKYRENSIDNAVYLLYCDYSAAYKWILDSAKPETYFINYQKSIQILEALCQYIGVYRFQSPTPDQQLDDLKSKYIVNTNRFIARYWNHTLNDAQKLKTQKGKENRINQFFDSLLIDNRSYLFEDNIAIIKQYHDSDLMKQQPISKTAVVCKDYDMHTKQGIQSISRLDFEVMRPLQKCATAHKRNGDLDLAIECLRKSNQISDCNPNDKLLEKEYLRVLSHIKLTKDNEAYVSEDRAIRQRHPEFWDKRITNIKKIRDEINKIHQLGTDLVTVSGNPSCPVCSKYMKTVYSISGKDKNYPQLPQEIIHQTHTCTNDYMSLCMYIEGISTPPQ